MRQWIRKARVTLSGGGGSTIINPSDRSEDVELRIAFQVQKDLDGQANTVDLTLYNLAESTRNSVGKEWDTVEIEAGYAPPEGGGNVGQIFKGEIRDVYHDREGPSILTTISCGDGDLALRRATINKTFPKGSSVQDVVDELYAQLEAEGIDRGEWKFPDDMREFRRPYTACGSCRRELDRLGKSNKFYWSLQNETLEIVPGDGYLGGVVYLSPETGLVGVPTLTDNGVRAKALLNPEIRPGRRVQIESDVLEMNAEGGLYRVTSAIYDGDTHQGDFIVEIAGEAIKDGAVDEGVKK